MKRILYLLVAFCMTCMSAIAQQKFFYNSEGKIICLTKIDSLFFVEFDSHILLNTKIGKEITQSAKSQIVSQSKYTTLKQSSYIKQEKSVYLYSDGTLQSPNGKLFVYVKDNYIIQTILEELQIAYQSISCVPGFDRTFEIQVDGDVFELANAIYRTGKVVFAEPSFIRFVKLNTVPNNYHFQWGFNNTGQYGGTNGIDINTPEAWNVTKGDSSIKIAVLDVGIDLDHSDLNLSSGFDAVPRSENVSGENGAPANRVEDADGTACAGIISALDNNSGCVGVAPNCKIMSVRIGYSDVTTYGIKYLHTDDSWVLSAFDYANNNGASVISCSFSLGTPSSVISNKINTLVSSGRNGNGCVIVASAGNDDQSSVGYLAALSSTITVGAMSQCGQRKSFNSCDGESWGSNYGTALDVVAPGVKIYTTDISSSKGYNSIYGENGNYYTDFNGTSAACPHVSGIAALILSVNPNLSALQVRNIIESTAQKVGGYTYSGTSGRTNGTWNNQMGYGLVDAKAAVLKALDLSISGPSNLCPADGASTYSISNLLAGTTVSWSCSGKLSIVGSTTGATCNIKGTTGGLGSVTANVNINGTSTQIYKNVDVSSDPADPNARIYVSHYSVGNGMIRLEISDPGIYGTKAYIWNAQAIGGGGSSQSTQTGPNGDYWTIPAGNYNVEVRAVTQCGHIIGTNTIYAAGSYSSSASPNPANNTLNVNIEELENGGANTLSATPGQISVYYDIRLYNMQGTLLRSLRVVNGQTSIDVSGLPNGNYFLHVNKNGSGEPQVHKVIVSH